MAIDAIVRKEMKMISGNTRRAACPSEAAAAAGTGKATSCNRRQSSSTAASWFFVPLLVLGSLLIDQVSEGEREGRDSLCHCGADDLYIIFLGKGFVKKIE